MAGAAVDPVAAAVGDSAELFGVEVHELALPLALVADDLGAVLESVQPAQTVASEDGVHR
jgi:hypothetical protein